jgi:VWFA-related protein
MKKLIAISLAALFVAFPVLGQQTPPQPKATPPAEDVVRISTNLIQIDATVTDSKGHVITDLKPNEIEIYENGRKQDMTNFSFVSQAPGSTPLNVSTVKRPVALPPSITSPGPLKRAIAIIVDDLTMSFQSAAYTRTAIRKFVDEHMQDGDFVAILRTGADVGALQQFTNDKRLLYAAIDRIRWNSNGIGGIGPFPPVNGNLSSPDQADQFRTSLIRSSSLNALRRIVRGLSSLAGRKTVLLFSDGFGSGTSDDDLWGPVRHIVEIANRGSVVIYSVDPRGLQYTGPTAADRFEHPTSKNIGDVYSMRSGLLWKTQADLASLSDPTGGFLIKNTNDLSGGIRQILESQSYYLIGYEPDPETFDPTRLKLNKIEIKILRPGANVRYRNRFLNLPDKAVSPGSSAAQYDDDLDSPFDRDTIKLRLNTLVSGDAEFRSVVHTFLHVNAANLTFVDSTDGRKRADLDLLAVAFGVNEKDNDRFAEHFSVEVPVDVYKQIVDEGFVHEFIFPFKKPGGFSYVVALHDVNSGREGSVGQFLSVPDLKKSQIELSGVVLENRSADIFSAGTSVYYGKIISGPIISTALRRIREGSALEYGFEVYNARPDRPGHPQITNSARIYHDGKIVFEGPEKPFDSSGQTDLRRLKVSEAIKIGTSLSAGNYVLQITVTDRMADVKHNTASQFVEFEVVK